MKHFNLWGQSQQEEEEEWNRLGIVEEEERNKSPKIYIHMTNGWTGAEAEAESVDNVDKCEFCFYTQLSMCE